MAKLLARAKRLAHASSTRFVLTEGLSLLFRAFHAKELPIEAVFLLVFVTTAHSMCSMLAFIFKFDGRHDPISDTAFLLGIPVFVLGWIFFYLKFRGKYHLARSQNIYLKYTNFIQNAMAIALSLYVGMRFYAKTEYGRSCGGNAGKLTQSLFCNPNHDTEGFPEDAFSAALLLPITYSTMLRDLDMGVSVASILIVFFFLALSSYDDITRAKYTATFMFGACSLLTLYSNQKQNVRSFMVHQQLAAVIKQNEEMAEELRANELRHMIGNVAHDLKTPLASFVTGLDMIADIAQDGLDKVNEFQGKRVSASASADPSPRVLADVRHCLLAMVSTVQNNRNINNFMMMTINRCIDYTKASKGVKLVPKYETIDLMDTLTLPFKCMADVTQKVHVHLEPISDAICSHVITDKQWLQENILCLLSNAVKYSAGGVVKGRVTLTTAGKVGPGHRAIAPVLRLGSSNESDMDAMVTPRVSDKPTSAILTSPPHSFRIRPYYNPRQVTADSDLGSIHDGSTYSLSLSDGERTINSLTPVPAAIAAAAQPVPFNSLDSQQVLLVEVEDNGIGMTQEIMDTLFNAFKQAQRLAGGTGLGLFSLARRVEALGGSYGVKYRPDGEQGSLFWFSVPYRPDKQYAGLMGDQALVISREHAMEVEDFDQPPSLIITNLSPALTVKCGASAKHSTGLRILIVDDSPAIQKMMSMMLRRHGHVVDQADNGAHAVALISKTYESFLQDEKKDRLDTVDAMRVELQGLSVAYDVVLMDLQMPVMDGLEAMRRIRSSEQRLLRRGEELQQAAKRRSLAKSSDCMLNLSEKRTNVQFFDEDEEEKSNHSLYVDHNVSMTMRRKSRMLGSIHQLIVGVSANSDTETMQEAMQAGADAFMSKPFTIDAFYATINKCKLCHHPQGT